MMVGFLLTLATDGAVIGEHTINDTQTDMSELVAILQEAADEYGHSVTAHGMNADITITVKPSPDAEWTADDHYDAVMGGD